MKIGRAWETLGRSWKNPPWKKPHSAHLRTLQGIVSTSSRPPFAELPPGNPWNPFVSFSSVFHQVSGFLTVILIIALSPGYLNIFSPSNYRSWSTWWYMIWLTWAWVRIGLAMDPPTHTHTHTLQNQGFGERGGEDRGFCWFLHFLYPLDPINLRSICTSDTFLISWRLLERCFGGRSSAKIKPHLGLVAAWQ